MDACSPLVCPTVMTILGAVAVAPVTKSLRWSFSAVAPRPMNGCGAVSSSGLSRSFLGGRHATNVTHDRKSADTKQEAKASAFSALIKSVRRDVPFAQWVVAHLPDLLRHRGTDGGTADSLLHVDDGGADWIC